MLKRILTFMVTILTLFTLSNSVFAKEKDTHVLMVVSQQRPAGDVAIIGEIEIKLDVEKAPVTVKNFLDYARDGFYNGTIFHRVISNFMIQGGGFTADMQQKQTKAPIKNEADNELRNKRGSVAMARTSAKDSATSQFFINLVDNKFLDRTPATFGYAVFGEVVKGMDVVDKIAAVPTQSNKGHENVPVNPIIISSIKVLP